MTMVGQLRKHSRIWTPAVLVALALALVGGRLTCAGAASSGRDVQGVRQMHSRGMDAAPSGIWQPAIDTSWQWQLTTPVDLSVDAAAYDIDLFDNDAGVVAALHALGRKAVCYVDVGTY